MFCGATATKPRLPNMCYSFVDVNNGSITSESYVLESIIWSSCVCSDHEIWNAIVALCQQVGGNSHNSYAVALAVWPSLLYWQLRCWKQVHVPLLIADHRAVVILTLCAELYLYHGFLLYIGFVP